MPDYGFGRCDGHHKMIDFRLEKSSGLGLLPRLARIVVWDSIGVSRKLDSSSYGPKAPARPGLSLFSLYIGRHRTGGIPARHLNRRGDPLD